MTALNKLAAQYNALLDMDQSDESFKDSMESISLQIQKKGKDIDGVLKEMKLQQKGIDDEIKRLQSLKKVVANRDKQLRDWLRLNMERTGINKITWTTGSITLSKPHDGVVNIDSEDQIPDEYKDVQVKVSIDKKAILEDLKQGFEVPGASLSPTKRKLTIR